MYLKCAQITSVPIATCHVFLRMNRGMQKTKSHLWFISPSPRASISRTFVSSAQNYVLTYSLPVRTRHVPNHAPSHGKMEHN